MKISFGPAISFGPGDIFQPASIQTTERYLGVEQNLTDAPCDHLGIQIRGGNN